MTTRWEKRDKKHSAKWKIKKQGNDFFDDDESYFTKKRKKKRHRSKNIDYNEYINEEDVE